MAKKKIASKSKSKKTGITKAQVKSFMGAVMNKTEVSEIEGTKDTKQQRRAGL